MSGRSDRMVIRPASEGVRRVLGLEDGARIAVAASELTESSLEESLDIRAERYYALFRRFCIKAVLGLGSTVTLDLLRDETGFHARILMARAYPGDEVDDMRPDLQLERLRL